MFTIGELARRTGLPVKTIRFYSDEGLLPPTERTRSGYRLYDVNALAKLELVRTLRELGIGLSDVERVIGKAQSVKELAERHVGMLDEQIRLLRLRRAVLRAVANRESQLDEVKLMSKLAGMSDSERKKLVDEFWDEVTAGLDVDSAFYARMRSAKPELPDDPSPEQLDAWLDFAELVRDPDFRTLIRSWGREQADRRAQGQGTNPYSEAEQRNWTSWIERARSGAEAGLSPDSAEARALADEVVRKSLERGETDSPAYRAELADKMMAGADPRAERYWQLLAVINGWPPIQSSHEAMVWLTTAIRG
ncbi:MerR family transcriptional regulator [Saccharomonospora sp. NPDC006951]